MKKIVVAILTLIIISTNVVYANDLSDWAKEEYEKANKAGILSFGIMLSPMKKEITRVEFCELILPLYEKLSGKDDLVAENAPFEDTDNENVAKAYVLGIISGISDTEFAPDEVITREQIAKMVIKTLTVAGEDIIISKQDKEYIDSFSDSEKISDWAENSFAAMLKYGLMQGVSYKELSPDGVVSREQAILIAQRVFDKFQEDIDNYPTPILTSVSNNTGDLVASWNKVSGAYYYRVIIKNDSYNARIVFTTKNLTATIPKEKLEPNIAYTVVVCTVFDDGTYTFSEEKAIKIQSSGNANTNTNTDTSEQPPIVNTPKVATTEKELRIFEDGLYYLTKEQAEKDMVKIEVDVWNISSNGEKVATKMSLSIHKNLAEDVKKIFKEIYEDDSKYPIKSMGGFQWRKAASGKLSQHSYGTCIDINPNENYYLSASGQLLSGSYWKPGDDPYSITEDGIVVKTFAKYGFLWGGNAWGENSAKDYMHFTYLGN